MKHLYSLAPDDDGCHDTNAEINPDYSAPTQLTEENFEG